jgi:hypothetical protein
MTHARTAGMGAVIALFWVGLGACDPSDPCDDGYHEVHGACYKDAELRDASVPSDDEDGGDEDSADAEAPSPADLYEFFGDDCSDESGCPQALICGAPELPVCTQVNCLQDEALCPPDWACTDISAFSPDPDVTSICLQM